LAELNVPEQVAVLGIGDDEFVCEFANPTLSSISLNYEQAGRVAAQRLGAIMDEKYAPAESVVQPIGVTQRESTGYVALNDPDVRDALRLIRESLEDKLTVDDLAAAVHVSPRTLLRKFKQTLGRSPGELVRQMRLDEARRLIISTDLTFQQIATRTGLGAASQFGHAIKNATGQSPGELRKDYRMR
jgi:LacI family transcriptional regulator